jgi:hypothetical protein
MMQLTERRKCAQPRCDRLFIAAARRTKVAQKDGSGARPGRCALVQRRVLDQLTRQKEEPWDQRSATT